MRHGISSPTHLPEFLASYDYARLYNEALINDGQSETYSPEELEAYRSGSDPYFYPDVNWYDVILRSNAPISRYNLDFSGGTENVNYFVLLNYGRNAGLYKPTERMTDYTINSMFQQFNFRSNIDIVLSKGLMASFTIGGNIVDKANPAGNYTGGIFGLMGRVPPNSFPVYNPDGSYGGSQLYSNPLGDVLETGMYTSNGRTFQGAYRMTQQLEFITKGLSVSGEIAFNNGFESNSNKFREYERYSISRDVFGDTIYNRIGQTTSLDGNEGLGNQWELVSIRSNLNYSRVFNSTEVSGLLMYNQSAYTSPEGGLPYLNQGMSGRFTLAQSKKYITEFSFAYSGMDVYPPQARFGFFPAGSLGWVVSNEEFLSSSNVINFLKIRGSYGLSGKDFLFTDNSRFLFHQNWGGQGTYWFGNNNRANSSQGEESIVNVDLSWEKQKQVNLGLEATIFNRLDITLDYFNQERYDILATPNRDLPDFIGRNINQFNVGIVENKGVEGSATYRSKQGEGLGYFIRFDVWYNKNKIIDNAEIIRNFEYLNRTGQPVGQRFILEAIGFFEDQDEIDNSPIQVFSDVVVPGDIKYKDQNGDGIIDDNDVYPIGNSSIPNLSGVLSAGIKFKGFDMDFMLQGVTRTDVMLSGSYYYAFQNNAKITKYALGRWTPTTHEEATYPRLSSTDNLNNYRPSTFWLKDGSFIKLRYLELGYTLPESLLNKLFINGLRIYLNGTNLFSFDHLEFSDPESIYGYPPVRTFNIGVDIDL